jgi:hypothetical protein
MLDISGAASTSQQFYPCGPGTAYHIILTWTCPHGDQNVVGVAVDDLDTPADGFQGPDAQPGQDTGTQDMQVDASRDPNHLKLSVIDVGGCSWHVIVKGYGYLTP